MATLGIEEEYVFLDPVTLEPMSVANEVYRSLGISRVESPQVQREFLVCQLERTTPVCETLDDATRDLSDFRRRLRGAAEEHGSLAAATGTAPRVPASGQITDKERYRSVHADHREVTRRYYYNGLHVHVGIPDRDAGVRAMNQIRRWMPVVVALGGNSPFWTSGDTGFASWRTVNQQRWTTPGSPPVFADAEDYARRTSRLVGIGGLSDRALLQWNIRLSDSHPTIEVRAADVQLEVWQTVMLAAIIRGLTVTAMAEDWGEGPEPELLHASLWHAARDGITDNLVHPESGELQPARHVANALLATIGEALQAEGDYDEVDGCLRRLFDEGAGADRQRAAFRSGGLPALAALLRNTLHS